MASRMTMPRFREMPNLLALRRAAHVVVAVPLPDDPRTEIYAASAEEAEYVLATWWSRADLLAAAGLRGITGISPRATRRDLAQALVRLGPAWFGDGQAAGERV